MIQLKKDDPKKKEKPNRCFSLSLHFPRITRKDITKKAPKNMQSSNKWALKISVQQRH